MALPTPASTPPFDITRASHVVLDVRDPAASSHFYTELVGLVVTEATEDVVYLRGVEEACHHSLVLRRADAAACERIGFRVRRDEDLDAALAWARDRGLPAEFVEAPYQGRTLHTTDAAGIPVELVASMPTVPRKVQALDFHELRGAAAPRFDHYQIHVPEHTAATQYYAELGFRTSEYISVDGSPDSDMLAAFLARKGNANDIVLLANEGPELHHFGYAIHDAPTTMLRLGDLAGSLGYGNNIEYGPSRHGVGCETFLYLRDPDGHRIELLSHPYQFIDEEEQALGWPIDDPRIVNLYGSGPSPSWFTPATQFRGVKPAPPSGDATLDTWVEARNKA